jgi:hypothetical protein
MMVEPDVKKELREMFRNDYREYCTVDTVYRDTQVEEATMKYFLCIITVMEL